MPRPLPTVLVVDDEELIRWALEQSLTQAGYRVLQAASGREALERCSTDSVDVVILDYRLPDCDGLQLLKQIKEIDPEVPVILLTAFSSVEHAVEAMKQGAYHYANKPFNLQEVLMLVEKALEAHRLRREVRALRATQGAPHSVERLIGESPAMQSVKALLRKIASGPASTVLLTGETGTGKDLAAKAIHYSSDRASAMFVNITCSALPEALLESELFGHERGAFTDARQQKRGLLELAASGTVFLDEIGEMPRPLQAKLLRFLEEKTFRRVGGLKDVLVDVRVVAATNRDLEQTVQDGKFREDLYYRLGVLPVTMPPLRDRTGDVTLLVNYFIDSFNREFGKHVQSASATALSQLEAHHWPGNVRELKNAVERAMLLAESDTLTVDTFDTIVGRSNGSQIFQLPASGVNLEHLERDLVSQALQRTSGSRTRAAALLGLNRDQIRYRIEKFGLEVGRRES
ncbi:MAG TPA: sigma-54 dependent transcriptional regulator [Vicinamibacterales bacterium]|nr:sigma-54 dependent transcriptional regulator [Vicinamibacterales bacterium]